MLGLEAEFPGREQYRRERKATVRSAMSMKKAIGICSNAMKTGKYYKASEP